MPDPHCRVSRVRLKHVQPDEIFGDPPQYRAVAWPGSAVRTFFKLTAFRTYERCSLMEFVRNTR